MKHDYTSDDERLNAFVDGELGAVDTAVLLERIEADSALRGEICDIHRIKDMMRYAYPENPPYPRQGRHDYWRWVKHATAALLLLGIGYVGGSLIQQSPGLSPFHFSADRARPDKVVLFIGESNTNKFEHVLDKAEQLLIRYKDMGVEVNVVASAGGIDLLRKRVSPFADRVHSLAAAYDTLHFVACNNTIARMAQEGKPVELIDEAEVHPSAVQFVVNRLREGWSYVAI